MCDESFAMTGIDCKRGTMGSSSQHGSGASSSLSCTRSDGHVCSRRCVSCFHLGFGADAICKMFRKEDQICGTVVYRTLSRICRSSSTLIKSGM
jgi:hypothetical protein